MRNFLFSPSRWLCLPLLFVAFSAAAQTTGKGLMDLPPQTMIAQGEDLTPTLGEGSEEQGYVINFNDVSIIELIRFISRISDKNFIFDEKDLDFNVSIVSQEPTSIQNILAALLQVLRINSLTLLEQGNNLIIHRNNDIRRPARIVTADGESQGGEEEDIVTRVYRLQFADPERMSEVIRPVVSKAALIDVLIESRHLIVTDLSTNIAKITELVKGLDRPNQALTIGQYVVQNSVVDSLVTLSERILRPIAADTPLFLVPQSSTKSIYVISTPYFVKRAVAVLETIDVPFARTRILSFRDEDLSEDGRLGNRLEAPPRITEGFDPFGQGQSTPPSGQGTTPQSQPLDFGPGALSGFQGAEFLQEERPARISTGQPGVQRFLPGQGQSGLPFDLEQITPLDLTAQLPPGHIDATTFFVYKLEYRRGDQIVESLQRIAQGLAASGTVNLDLLNVVSSAQWLSTSNSIIFAGTRQAIERVRMLMQDIDVPLRQVFIEMLILETSINNSLQIGVEYGALVSEPEFGANAGFFDTGSAVATALGNVDAGANVDPTGLAAAAGLSLGIIGKNVTFGGMGFESLGLLIHALNSDSDTNIIMNPKIITEDNNAAEIFVGENTRFRTQSIASQASTNVVTNFEYRDVGNRLRVLPIIGNNDVVTLEIDQEITADTGETTTESDLALELGPVTSRTTTQTRVHVPNKYFLVISGMIREQKVNTRTEVPCLGGIPFLGHLFGTTTQTRNKRNLMLFLRPIIIDTADDIRELTRQQQELFREKSRTDSCGNFQASSCLDFLKPGCG